MFSLQDLEQVEQEPWDGVRNYQARNFMRDGNRLSIMPVEGKHFRRVCKMGGWDPKSA